MHPTESVHCKTEEPADWQSSLFNLKQRGSHLLKSGLWTDCVFLVGPDKVRIAAHKLFLAMSSPVFEAMFYGGMAEGSAPILVPDVEPESFKCLLEFVYTEHVTINSFEDAYEIFYTAKKYLVSGLISFCQVRLVNEVSTTNVCQAYELASMFDDANLMAKCEEILSTYTSEIINQPSFLEAHPSMLMKLFSLESLNVHNELVLLSAAEKYASARGLNMSATCGEPVAKRARIDEGQASAPVVAAADDTVLDMEGDVLSEEELRMFRSAVKQIRFLTLSAEELAKGITQSSLVPRGDALAILLHAASILLPAPQGYCLSRTLRHTQIPNAMTEQHPVQPKAEISIQFSVLNFKTRRRRVESGIFYCHGIAWTLLVVPKELYSYEKMLGLFVKCVQSRDQWSCNADVSITLKGVTSATSRTKKFTHLYTSALHTEGFADFVTWEEASDNTIFCTGNCVVVEVHISADKPTRLCDNINN